MKKFKFDFRFLDRFKKNKNEEHEIGDADAPHEVGGPESDYESDESPEDFAEKTLGGFNINKYRQQLQEAKDTVDSGSEESSDEESSETERDQHQEDYEPTEPNFQFQQMPLPGKPEVSKKFNFKFPKFNFNPAAEKIKAGLSGNSPINTFEKLSWNDFVLRLFSPYTRGKVHSLFIILLVITVTYMVGKNMALFFNKPQPVAKTSLPLQLPQEKANTTIQDINKITSTNLFNAKQSDKSAGSDIKKDVNSIICLDAEKATNLEIKLLDTIVLQDSVKSVASVQIRGSSELTNVREGERLDEMAEVSKIGRLKVILKNLETGDCEYAMTDAEPEQAMPDLKILSPKAGRALFKSLNPNIKNVGNTFKIKRTFRDSMINNMSDVLTQAKAVQITNPDGSLCFKMTEVVPGSLYTQLNIQDNDIICNINGKKIDNLNELMGLLGRMKEIDQFQIGLKRNGMNENLEYGFE